MNRRVFCALPAVLLALTRCSGLGVQLSQLDSSRLLLAQEVSAYVSVTGDDGLPLTSLPRSAFHLQGSADGAHFGDPVAMTSFVSPVADLEGVTFLLLLDNSGSMYDALDGAATTDPAQQRIMRAKSAIRDFLRQMVNPADRVGLAVFNTSLQYLAPPRSSAETVMDVLDGIPRPAPRNAYTELFASLEWAAHAFAGVPGRKSVVVLSDGENFPPAGAAGRANPFFGPRTTTAEDAIRACQNEGVSISAICLGPTGEKPLASIARETGGRLFDVTDSEGLRRAYDAIHRQVHGEYRLAWRASTAPAEKAFVRVTVDASSVHAEDTRFYFTGSVFGPPLESTSPFLLIPFLLPVLVLSCLVLLRFEKNPGPARLEVLRSGRRRLSAKVVMLDRQRTVIGSGSKSDLLIAGARGERDGGATISYDPSESRYTLTADGQVMVNNQPVQSRALASGDVIQTEGVTILFSASGGGRKENDFRMAIHGNGGTLEDVGTPPAFREFFHRRYHMPFRLFNGVYAVRCRHPHCPFNDQIKIDQNIVGMTEEDVRSEALKTARDQATVRHDSIYGRQHGLENPEVRMASGMLQRIGAAARADTVSPSDVVVHQFRKGEVILKKGEAATTVCEVLEGSAYPLANKAHRYNVGDCFGVAALVPNRRRMSDIIASSDGTSVAFYDLADLRQSEPGRASRLFSRLMEDTLQVVDELGRTVDRLRKGRHKLAS